MNWRLRRLAGAPDGTSGSTDGTFDDARFDKPLDLVLSADEEQLYIADANNGIRRLILDGNTVYTYSSLTDIPRWDTTGTLSGRARNLSITTAGMIRVTADNATPGDPGVIFELDTLMGTQESSLSTAGTLGAIDHDPSGDTATVKMHINEAGTGWGTLALNGPDRGTITEPPVIPDPPFCDPPTNSVPVQVMTVRDADSTEDSGLARVGSIVVAFYRLPGGTGSGVVAFDPWNETAFPSPYTTCTTPTDPTSVSVVCSGNIATLIPPWSATRGPDDPLTGLPTVIGAAWRSPNGVLLRAVLDEVNATLNVDYDLVPELVDLPVIGVAYSPMRQAFYFTTAAVWGDPGTNAFPNQVLEFKLLPDPPIYMGGSGRIPIGGVVKPTGAVGIIDEDGDVLADEGDDILIFGG